MKGTTHPVTQHHIPDDFSLQQNHCENVKSLWPAPCKVSMISGVWMLPLMVSVTDLKKPGYSV